MTTEWHIKGPQFTNCNCDYGCPCQFNAMPTSGRCYAIAAGRIEDGHYGDVSLEGLKWASILSWPGPIHEGQGSVQIIIDKNADEQQREALLAILSGADTEPGATHFNVFASTMTTLHDPLFMPIDIKVDVDGRTATVRVEGVIEAQGEPIRNPVTGAAHRAQISMPEGFEYVTAEIGSGKTTTTGAIPLTMDSTHAHWAVLNMNQSGVIR
ncbi:MAG: DUF1326 domain-containing protein [Gammaproteobacteria bacterium]|nr:DUF1326 domain-containing protein [Gammaproteobacteria bacterium]NNF60620.1 DUF1326 domain-containing protein [Gammaproteobacteria bacterium]